MTLFEHGINVCASMGSWNSPTSAISVLDGFTMQLVKVSVVVIAPPPCQPNLSSQLIASHLPLLPMAYASDTCVVASITVTFHCVARRIAFV